jgi:hypothetical protein
MLNLSRIVRFEDITTNFRNAAMFVTVDLRTPLCTKYVGTSAPHFMLVRKRWEMYV